MRVLQLIDSLRPGGAERMAVNIANALQEEVEASYICCTRLEGKLQEEISSEVGYLFLHKKYTLDLKAFLLLRKFIRKERVGLVHAHGSSWFFGVLLKLSGCKVKLIWHDHYGESERLEERKFFLLKVFSRFLDGVLSVNFKLKEWALQELYCKKVIRSNNFISRTQFTLAKPFQLKASGSFRIICVANLRPQKDHLNLLRAYEVAAAQNPELSLHLIGEDPGTDYSCEILDYICRSPFSDKIFYYGSQTGIAGILSQAQVGVLASRSEGLPLTLLEYGYAGLPVICTRVGDCPEVVRDAGLLVSPEDNRELAAAILEIFEDDILRKEKGKQFKNRIKSEFDKDRSIKNLIKFYKNI